MKGGACLDVLEPSPTSFVATENMLSDCHPKNEAASPESYVGDDGEKERSAFLNQPASTHQATDRV